MGDDTDGLTDWLDVGGLPHRAEKTRLMAERLWLLLDREDDAPRLDVSRAR